MIAPVQKTSNGVVLTQRAVDKVAQLIREEADLSLRLRLYITGGGCSGFQYGFMFDHQDKKGDRHYHFFSDDEEDEEGEGGKSINVVLVIDVISYPYLKGVSVDYQVGVEGQRFVVNNPNANTQCGCGSSFSV